MLLDADASLDPDFLWQLHYSFVKTPSAQSAAISESPLPIDYISDDLYVENAKQFLRMVTRLMEGKRPGCTRGPTLSFKAYIHQQAEIRKYMFHPSNEDYQLGDDLHQYSNFIFLPEPRIFLADRKRPEGFDANFRCCLSDTRVPYPLISNFFEVLKKRPERFSIPIGKYSGLHDLNAQELGVILDNFRGQNNRETEANLNQHLEREEKLARERFDWAKVNTSIMETGIMLFALGRIALGKTQVLQTYI